MKRTPQVRLAGLAVALLAAAISRLGMHTPPPSNGRDMTSAFDARYRPIREGLPPTGPLSYWSDDPDEQRDFLVQYAIAPRILAVGDTSGDLLLVDARGGKPGVTPPPDALRRGQPRAIGPGLYLFGKRP